MRCPLFAIAREIRPDWPDPYFGVVPYIGAMSTMVDVDEPYGADPGADIVRYFLSNAKTWRGETARRVKAELKRRL